MNVVATSLPGVVRVAPTVHPDPRGNFLVLSETAHVYYKCTDFYDPADQIGIRWDEPDLGIDWPLTDVALSPRDAAAPSWRETEAMLREAGA